MAQIKQKQILNLTADLAAKVASASNQGSGQGAIFKSLVGTDLQFHSIGDGNALNVNAAATDVIVLDVDVSLASATKATAAVAGDFLLIQDSEAANVTKKISVANLQSALNTTVDFADFTSVAATADTDSIIFFDASNTNATKRQTKAQFLANHAKLISPSFTGTPTAPTATSGTNTTQIATTAYVKGEVDSGLSGLDFQPDVLNSQTDATLNPGATPTLGDRYIIENAAALHANFGTIATVASGDIVEYDGVNFVVSYDVSVAGPGALSWDVAAVSFRRWDGTTWANFGGLAGVTAGAGLTKTGNTLDVVAGTGITVNANDVQISASYAGQSSITTLGTVATGVWNGTTIAVADGGTGLTTVAANSVVASTTADTLAPVALTASTVLGRAAAGGVAALAGADIQTAAATRQVKDEGSLSSASMTLGTLSQTPGDATKVVVSINGLILDDVTDYTISGLTVTATNALNVSYGGTLADGLGFEATDKFIASYEY